LYSTRRQSSGPRAWVILRGIRYHGRIITVLTDPIRGYRRLRIICCRKRSAEIKQNFIQKAVQHFMKVNPVLSGFTFTLICYTSGYSRLQLYFKLKYHYAPIPLFFTKPTLAKNILNNWKTEYYKPSYSHLHNHFLIIIKKKRCK